ncbi:hypothetical protein PIB30_096980, partial [Stylosanthes scabra]|nr:hypothetical protein [Stylosanthes scabra]
AWMQGNRDKQAIEFDPEIERTLRKLKKKAKQHVVNQVIEEVEQNNMAAVDGNEQRRTLGDYTIPSIASCGSSIVHLNVKANNFELKPSNSAGSTRIILWKFTRRPKSAHSYFSAHL